MKLLTERRLSTNRGSEGPRHDPYGYEEYTVCTKFENGEEKCITMHSGLGMWLKIDGEKIDHGTINMWGEHYNEGERFLSEMFENLTGIPLCKFHKYMDEILNHKICCPKRELEWVRGFPGEHLLICTNCHAIADSQFVRSEIE